MKTYVQCPYCMGYNTHRIPIMRTLDGRIEIFQPVHIIRFSGIDCKPKEWSPIVGEDYKFMGFCNYCQAKFLIEKENIIRITDGEDTLGLRQKPFFMRIDDVFSINIGNTPHSYMSVVVGQIESGFISIGDKVIISSGVEQIEATVCGIEMFRKNLPSAEFGDNAGIVLNVDKAAIHQGGILTKHIICN